MWYLFCLLLQGYKLARQCKSIVSMEWKQITSDAQRHMSPTVNMRTESVASMDNSTTTTSQEQLFFERVIVRYCTFFLSSRFWLHHLRLKRTLDILCCKTGETYYNPRTISNILLTLFYNVVDILILCCAQSYLN